MKNSTNDNIKGDMAYTGVNLRWNNKTHRRIIGRILCFVFRDEPVPQNWKKMQVNHKNEIPSDNSREIGLHPRKIAITAIITREFQPPIKGEP